MIARALREQGYAVDEASDGVDGFYKATAWGYDAVVLDLMLPQRMTGLFTKPRFRQTIPAIGM